MKILGIESSADETAAAVVEDGYKLLGNAVASSLDLHIAFGGIVPEIAARSHLEVILPVIDEALWQAFSPDAEDRELSIENGGKIPNSQFPIPNSSDLWSQIDAIAVTQGPGLIGSLLIGALTARTLAITKGKPLYGVNHVLAHAYANFITEASSSLPATYLLPPTAPKFPILGLIVSGGHTQLMLYKNHKDYEMLGQTRDDAVGEAYDKVAKILGLPYPGGPSVDRAAADGDPLVVKLPQAKLDNPYEFSFSGLKTAVLRAAQAMAGQDYTFPSYELPHALTDKQKADIAASFQKTAVKALVDATAAAEAEFKPKTVLLAGGVAANRLLREELAKRLKAPLLYPDIKLCTDNAAMIAATAFWLKPKQDNPYKLAVIPNL
ncbi:MAG TPA: tRNA (adenosine(37)-N6)-threonylcarbamoyltransferase complex transferase subunit TsaD [Candidatus Saccharimonadales bacterium]|nr:tRNA (adenosine(37)-N6)-threonylcarbamoyltransferase complex transferase subunit TsaD [Candidatus Saccharimonadales bacterium]